jgi:hypothetical protein
VIQAFLYQPLLRAQVSKVTVSWTYSTDREQKIYTEFLWKHVFENGHLGGHRKRWMGKIKWLLGK